MSPRARALLLVLVLAPAVALCLLGLRALRAEEADARDEARATAGRIRADLHAELERLLAVVRTDADSGAGLHDPFRVGSDGRILLPETRSFPARARSFAAGDLVAMKNLLERADRAMFAENDPRAAMELLLPAIGLFEDEDLAAILRDRAAAAAERAGAMDDAVRLCATTMVDHPEARDLDGFPLYIAAARRAASVRARPHVGLTLTRLARTLAENPWGLPEERRVALLRDLPEVTEEVLYAALRAVVIPEVMRGGTSGPDWVTLPSRVAGRNVLVTYRVEENGDHVGALLTEDFVEVALAMRCAEIAEVTGARITPGGAPTPAGFESVSGPFPAPFGAYSAAVAVRPRGASRWLPILWGGLSVLLLGGLAGGVLLGLRAVSREVRLARMRQEFLDNVSHELRTPLASIRALAENLRDGAVPEDRTAEYFDALQRESCRVARLVEDVLDLSRLDRGAARLCRDRIDPASLASDAVAELAAEPGAADFAVRIEASEDLPSVHGDPDAIRRALVNLLANAARYSPDRREADLRIDVENGHVRLAVEDHGPGIPESDRRLIFDRFHRVSSATHEVKGAGLGLPLALAVVEAHGGTIRLDSEVGRGSTFTIELPVEETT